MDRPELSADERAELERLRAEVAALRAQQATGATPGGPAAGGGRARWRPVMAALLIVLACVLAPLSTVAVWARNQVTDTDRYVRTVAPLARDAAIQQAVSDRITDQVFAYIDVRGLTTRAVDALAGRGLTPRLTDELRAMAGPIGAGVRGYGRAQVGDVVASSAFADAWAQANRLAHAELVKALTGEGGGAVTLEGDTVRVNLAPFIAVVRQRLVASGFELAARVPDVDVSFVLFQSQQVSRAQRAFHLLNTLGNWLPLVVLILLALGVAVARNHRRALAGAAVGVAVAMVVLAMGLAVFRVVYLDAIPSRVLPHDAAAVLYDTIVRFLRQELRTVLVLALVVAGGAFLTGPSPTALRARRALTRGIARVGGGADRAGLRIGRVGAWVRTNKPVLRAAAVTLAGLGVVFWEEPTGKVVLLLTVLLLVALALVELLSAGSLSSGRRLVTPPLAAPLPPAGVQHGRGDHEPAEQVQASEQ